MFSLEESEKWIEENKEILNKKKVIIDNDLWYIPNFLSEDELNYLKQFSDDEKYWYITARSYSIRNKFVNIKTKLFPDGYICPTRKIDLTNTTMFPSDEDERIFPPLWYKYDGVFSRMKCVLPKTLNEDMTMQSFWPLSDDEDLENPKVTGGAYNYHYEKGMAAESGNNDFNDNGMTAAWSIYLNDDFEGGILEFAFKPYKIHPQKGMLISIPMTKDFMHRVTPVTKGIRHTLYGVCYENLYDRHISSGNDC